MLSRRTQRTAAAIGAAAGVAALVLGGTALAQANGERDAAQRDLVFQQAAATMDMRASAVVDLGEVGAAGSAVGGQVYAIVTEGPGEAASRIAGLGAVIAQEVNGADTRSVNVCKVTPAEWTPALAEVTSGPTFAAEAACIDGKWGVQAERTMTIMVPITVNKVTVMTPQTYGTGSYNQAGPAFGR